MNRYSKKKILGKVIENSHIVNRTAGLRHAENDLDFLCNLDFLATAPFWYYSILVYHNSLFGSIEID